LECPLIGLAEKNFIYFGLSLFNSWFIDCSVIGVSGIFLLMAIKFFIHELSDLKKPTRACYKGFFNILKRLDLNRLNFGIFVLHITQIYMLMVIPFYLVNQGLLNLEVHWTFYLAVLAISFLCIIPIIIFSERWGKINYLFYFLFFCFLFSQLLFIYFSDGLQGIAIALLIYFIGFNHLEASLPSMVSKLAPIERRGLSLGVYNTFQSLGIFLGGFMGAGS